MAKNKTINMVKSQVIYKDYSKDAERTALVSGENLAHMFGKIARWYTDISWVGHTHTEANITDFGTYAGASTKGGAATSANKLNIGASDIGSETKPVYFNATTGKPVACAYSLNASVPANAVFTDINVKQSPSTADESREVLFAGNTGNTDTTGTVGKSNKLYFNPSTGALTATSFSGSVDASNLSGTIDAGRLPTTAVTAGSYGPAAGGTLAHGGTFDVAYVTVDKYGRLTAASTKTFTLPAQYVHPTYTSKTSGLYKITVDGTGHVSGTAAVTASDLPAHTHDYLPLTGGTVTGGITYKGTTYDVSAADNGVTTTSWPSTFNLIDKSDRIFTRLEGILYTNGDVGCQLYVRNYNTSGTQVAQKGISFIMNKSGSLSWSVSDPANFRSAISAAAADHTHPYLPESTVTGSPDLDTYLTSGVYHIKTQTSEHAPTTNHATLFVDGTVGTPYQLFIPDVSNGVWYSRYKSGSSAWSSWLSLKMTDTVYTHPTYTSKASGLYKITVDSTGHVSATAAVAAADLPSHTHAYLPLSGGTMTGAITFQVADAIKYNAASATYTMISFLTGDGNGHGISIGGGGLTVLGSGESASALISALSLAASNETTYIASDNNIEFYSYCQTIGNRLGIVFDTSGRLRPDTNNTRTLGGTDYYWNKAYISQIIGRGTSGMWISARDNAIVRQSSMVNESAYFPVVSTKTKLGEWSIGTLGPDDESIYFAYTTDANYNAGTNTNKWCKINSDGAFSGSASKWTTARTLTIGSTGKSVDGSGNVSWSLSEIGAASTSHSHSNYLPQAMVSTAPDLNTYDTTGVYHISVSSTNAPVTQHSTLYVEANVGTHYQIFKPDNLDTTWYTRHKVTGGWSDWVALKLTDTVYTHPTYTSKSSGLYKITVDSTGHVSATAAVAAADLPSHTHSYLPLAGGTMTGDITFTEVTSTDYPATSKAITFSGSTDAASIFFEVTASDKGCLVLQTTDDADAKIVFRNKVTASGTRANEVTITDGVIAGNGSGLTNLNASNISSGTLAEARLPKAYIPLAGSTAITGSLRVSMGNTAGPVISVNNGTYEIGLHVGSGGVNHGIYDFTSNINNWMCYHNGTEFLFNGKANTATTASKLGTNAGSNVCPVYFSGGVPVACKQVASGAYFSTVPYVRSDGVMDIGRYLDFHVTNDATSLGYRLNQWSAGCIEFNSYNANNIVQLYAPSGYAQLRFGLNETNKAYTAPGIIVNPLSTSGSVMRIQCGGNMIIGGGESPTTAYSNDYLSCATSESEALFLTADSSIYLVTNLDSYANRKIVTVSNGQIILANNGYIAQDQNSGSNYTTAIRWRKGGSDPGNYGPEIGQYTTGDTDGSICILPYHTSSNPWDAGVGLFISKTRLLYNGTAVSLNGHTHSYLPLSGGTLTGDLNFTGVTSTSYPAKSNQIYFSGSTDWAKIYYRVDASDAGRLVFDIGDDTNTRIDFAYNGTTKSYIDTSGNFSGASYRANYLDIVAGNEIRFSNESRPANAIDLYLGYAWSGGTKDAKINRYVFMNGNATLTNVKAALFEGKSTSSAYTNYDAAFNIQTGSSAQAKISLETLINWLINTKKVLPSSTLIHKIFQTGWSYANNDFLRITCNGRNYEIQLAGVIIEFFGSVSSYNTGEFRMMIHTSPTTSGTASSGYVLAPTSTTFVYTCNGSGYSPTWKMITNAFKYANDYWGLTDPNGNDNDWTRTTSNGIIPYQSGALGSGHQSIGTSLWYFSHVYSDQLHGYALGLGSSSIQGRITIQSPTTASVAYNSTNPRIRFANASNDQNIDIVMCDFDSVRGPAALSVHGNQGGEYLLAPNISAWDYTNNKLMAMLSAWKLGTTSVVGEGRVIAGNGTTKGTAGNAKGIIEIYSEQAGCVFLVSPSSISSSYTVTLPSSAGSMTDMVYQSTSSFVANTDTGLSTAINKLSTGTSTPSDNDYYVAQYAGGGTSVTSYHRRLHSALFSYINSKLYKILWSGSTSCTARSSTSITLTTAIAANKYRFIKVVWNCGSYTGISEFRADTLNVTNNIPSGSNATTTNMIQFKIASDGKSITVGPGTAAITVIQIAGVYPI